MTKKERDYLRRLQDLAVNKLHRLGYNDQDMVLNVKISDIKVRIYPRLKQDFKDFLR